MTGMHFQLILLLHCAKPSVTAKGRSMIMRVTGGVLVAVGLLSALPLIHEPIFRYFATLFFMVEDNRMAVSGTYTLFALRAAIVGVTAASIAIGGVLLVRSARINTRPSASS